MLTQLQAQMEAAAAALEFERAARIRDKIARLQQLQSRQFVESATAGDIDVVAAASERGLFAVNVVMIRGGRHVGDRTFFPRHADALDPAALSEIVPAFLEQHYVERPVPPTIVVPDADDHAALAEVLSAQSAQKVEIVGNPGGERRVWLAMALQNATLAIRQKLAQKATQEDRLAALQEALGLAAVGAAHRVLRRLAHDGRGGGGVVRDLRPARDADRPSTAASTSRPTQGGDDYAAMREALTRRCARIVAGEYPAPDLLVIDGGKGQVGVAAKVLEEQGLHGVPLIGIAKGPGAQGGRGGHRVPGPRRACSTCRPTIPGCTCCSRSATRRIASRSRAIARGARKARTTSTLQEIAGVGAAQAAGAARALRRPEGRAGGERGRPRARARHLARAGRADLRRAALRSPGDCAA